ncbi:MAG: alanine--tRNA ligase-related protein, partial [Nitrososphaerota archaeon]
MSKRIFPPEFYKLNFFLKNGFKRKECPICKEFYWTINEDQETCNEAPCVPYSFIGNPPSSKKFSLRETREKFLSFFKKNEHEIINPYPVVARWRTDLFLTDASIVDFQPFVTNG